MHGGFLEGDNSIDSKVNKLGLNHIVNTLRSPTTSQHSKELLSKRPKCHHVPGAVSECVLKENTENLLHKTLLFIFIQSCSYLFFWFLYFFLLFVWRAFPNSIFRHVFSYSIPMNPSLWQTPQISKLDFSAELRTPTQSWQSSSQCQRSSTHDANNSVIEL